MSQVLGFLSLKATGHVVAAFSTAIVPDTVPMVETLVSGQLLIRDPDTGDVVGAIEPKWLVTALLDAPREALVGPRGYRVHGEPKTLVLEPNAVTTITAKASGVEITLPSPPATPVKAWVQVESTPPERVLNAEGSFTAAGGKILVPISMPKDRYNIVLAVEGHALAHFANVNVP